MNDHGTIWRLHSGSGWPPSVGSNPTPYVMIRTYHKSEIKMILWDLRLGAPVNNFVGEDKIVSTAVDAVGIYHGIDYYDENAFISQTHSIPEFIRGNRAGSEGEELNWKEIKALYGWNDV